MSIGSSCSTTWTGSGYSTLFVAAVKVKAIQFSVDGMVFQDATSTLFVPLGSAVTFKALPSPDGASWPAGYPVWGGSSGATGTGDVTVVNFNTLSTEGGDFKTVTATCGNTETAFGMVFDFDGVLTPVVDFEGRSYDRYGVCETINLSYTITPSSVMESDIGGLQWEIVSGGGKISEGGKGTGTYSCSDEPGQFVLRLFISAGPFLGAVQKEKAKDKDAPTLVRFEKASDSKKYHVKGTASAGFKADQYFEPKDVSFDKIVWKEGFCKPLTAGGYDNDTDNKENHPESKEWFPTIKPGADGKGTNVGSVDKCYSSTLQKADWKDNSKFTWDIPWTYFNSGDELEADKTPKPAIKGKALFTVRQEWVSNAIGTCTISKPTLNVAAKKVEETRLQGEETIETD